MTRWMTGVALILATAVMTTPSHATPVQAVQRACGVQEATITWGTIERWRAYISGSIAHGGWDLEDVTYHMPEFVWSDGVGEVAPDLTWGEIEAAGAVRFSGHEDLLQVSLANPRLQFTRHEANLYLDLASTLPTGEPDVSAEHVLAVAFDEVELTHLEGSIATFTLSQGVLTAEGAAAFGGFYEAGEAVDTLTVVAPADCDFSGESKEFATDEDPNVSESGLPILPLTIGGIALIVIIGAVIALVRRR